MKLFRWLQEKAEEDPEGVRFKFTMATLIIQTIAVILLVIACMR